MIGNNDIYIGAGYPKRPLVVYTPTRFSFPCSGYGSRYAPRGAARETNAPSVARLTMKNVDRTLFIIIFSLRIHARTPCFFIIIFFFFMYTSLVRGRDNSWAGFRNIL